MFLRETLKPYIKEQMRITHEKGTPIMRPLFYDFPEDKKAWETDDAYMLSLIHIFFSGNYHIFVIRPE